MSLFCFLCLFYVNLCVSQENRHAKEGYGGMVGSAHYEATNAGINILKNGGNAADAAFAVQLTLNVVEPHMSGIGGGCFILYYNNSNKNVYAIDGREEAPNAYNPYIFCDDIACFLQNTSNSTNNNECTCTVDETILEKYGDFNTFTSGGWTVGSPGTLYAFYLLHKYFGKTEWDAIFQDAIEVATNGFPMYQEMYQRIINRAQNFEMFDASKKLYLNENGEPMANVGQLFKNSDFANTLLTLAQLTPDSAIDWFYKGELSREIVKAVQEANNTEYNRWGLMENEDLEGYQAIFREPITQLYGEESEYMMYGMNMPSGSPAVEMLMNLIYYMERNESNPDFMNGTKLSDYDINSGTLLHYLSQANDIVFADRNYYFGDSNFVDVPVKELVNRTYIKERAKLGSNKQVNPPFSFGEPNGNINRNMGMYTHVEHGTTHFFVVDQWNNIACVTSTMENAFGSAVVVPDRGFVLNNQLTDFDLLGLTPDGNIVANGPSGGKMRRRYALNLFDRHDNETFGGKRPRSSMSPIIVLDKEDNTPIIAIGTPGGSTIISTVFTTLRKILIDNMDVQQSIDSPRLWSFNNRPIRVEKEWWLNNDNITNELIERGYDILNDFINDTRGICQAVRFSRTYNPALNDVGIEYMLFGGSDDNRQTVASVNSVCGPNTNNDASICVINYDIKQLSNAQRISLIIGWAIILIFVILCVINREKVKRRVKKVLKKDNIDGYKDIDDTNSTTRTSDMDYNSAILDIDMTLKS